MSCCFSQTDCKHDNAKSCTNPHTPYKDWQCLNIFCQTDGKQSDKHPGKQTV